MNSIETSYHALYETIGDQRKSLKLYIAFYYMSPTLTVINPDGFFLLAKRFVDKAKSEGKGVLIQETTKGIYLRHYESRGVYELQTIHKPIN